jgi:hypothetical protein
VAAERKGKIAAVKAVSLRILANASLHALEPLPQTEKGPANDFGRDALSAPEAGKLVVAAGLPASPFRKDDCKQ